MMRLRSLLLWLALVLLISTAPTPVHGQDAEAVLRSGPMVGYSTHREAAVWVQTTRAADVQLRYWSVTSAEEAEQNPGVIPDPDTAYTAVQHVTAADDHIAMGHGEEVLLEHRLDGIGRQLEHVGRPPDPGREGVDR